MKKSLVFKGKETLKFGKISTISPLNFPNESVAFFKRKKVVQKQLIVVSDKTAITGLFLEKNKDYPSVHIEASIKDIEKFVKEMKQQAKKFKQYGFFVRLSPDVSFYITPKSK